MKINPRLFLQRIGLTSIFLQIAITIFLLIGWVLNLFEVIGIRYTDTITLEIILRVVGLFLLPLGGIMGWL